MESQDCNAKVHSRDGMAHDFFGSVRVGEEMYGSTVQPPTTFFFCRNFPLRDKCPSANMSLARRCSGFPGRILMDIVLCRSVGKACAWHKRGICECASQSSVFLVHKALG